MSIEALIISLLLIGGNANPVPCDTGFVVLNRTFDEYDIFHESLFPERSSTLATGYIALDWDKRDDMGKWYLFRFAGGDWRLVRLADVRQQVHQEAHDKLWGDTWLCEVDERSWGTRPVVAQTGTLCGL